MKKVLILLVALLVSMALFANGGGDKEVTADEQITLHWLQGGPGVQRDFQEVLAAANEVLPTYVPNTQIDIEIVTPAEIR